MRYFHIFFKKILIQAEKASVTTKLMLITLDSTLSPILSPVEVPLVSCVLAWALLPFLPAQHLAVLQDV